MSTAVNIFLTTCFAYVGACFLQIFVLTFSCNDNKTKMPKWRDSWGDMTTKDRITHRCFRPSLPPLIASSQKQLLWFTFAFILYTQKFSRKLVLLTPCNYDSWIMITCGEAFFAPDPISECQSITPHCHRLSHVSWDACECGRFYLNKIYAPSFW